VVRSTTDRVWAHLQEIVLRLRNALKNGDWPLVQDEFDAVNKKMDKSKAQIEQTGIPKFYIKMLAYLEDEITAAVADKEGVKKMKPVVGRAVNRMKVTIKKHNKSYEGEIGDYRANPTKYDTEVEESSDSDSDSDVESDEESVADKVVSSSFIYFYTHLAFMRVRVTSNDSIIPRH
jgi:translation initiation factor 3 subunit C